MQIEKSAFDIASLDDEIRVDGLCKGLLMAFYEALLAEGLDQAAATKLANGADHFVRDFVIGVKTLNLFAEQPGLVRQFAGNWYIVNTLEPSVDYLAAALPGVTSFYRYLADNGLVSTAFSQLIDRECDELPYFASRIASFWEITDNYPEWDQECPLNGAETALTL